ncbi:MAG: hypothetical protein K8I30_07045, partial [Anaerolineae bacterium]|nr:hypothetical protein [Anaerolineae bacterium]
EILDIVGGANALQATIDHVGEQALAAFQQSQMEEAFQAARKAEKVEAAPKPKKSRSNEE